MNAIKSELKELAIAADAVSEQLAWCKENAPSEVNGWAQQLADIAKRQGKLERAMEKDMYNLYENADSATESKGVFVTTMTSSSVKEFRNAIRTIEREEAVTGVWVNRRGREWFVELAA